MKKQKDAFSKIRVNYMSPKKVKKLEDMKPKFQGVKSTFKAFDEAKSIPINIWDGYKVDKYNGIIAKSAVESNQRTIFEEGAEIVNGPRHEDYGDFHDNMADIGLVWSGILGFTVEPKKVALCMAGLKLVREANKHKRDNGVDAIGYMGIAHEIGERE